MTRREFMEKSLMMGIGLPFLSSIMTPSCDKDQSIFPLLQTNFSGKVIIVGAGAAGMAAGYLLKRYGVDFQIIEAAPVYGGRLKKIDHFVDFPLDLGAEWIHTDPKILAEIINKPDVNAQLDILVYNPQSIKTWKDGKLKSHDYLSNLYSEWKFKRTTWFDFFEQFIMPDIADKIILNTPVAEINYGADKVVVKTATHEVYEADKILVTTSVKTLQDQQIKFQPPLPREKTDVINNIFMGDGVKIFIEFKEKFYPDILAFGNIYKALEEEEKYVYDAAFRKDADKHVLGLFAINERAKPYTETTSEEETIKALLAELDEIFDGKASANYIQHVIQNWSVEPYIRGSYSYSFDGNQSNMVSTLLEPVLNRIHFAGEALSIRNQATVHGACESAYNMIAEMMKDP